MRRWRPGHGDGPGADVLTEQHRTGGSGGCPARLVASVTGRVQGVGFRAWCRSRARELELTGWARNLPDGRVEVVAEGSRERCERLLQQLRSATAPGAVYGVSADWQDGAGLADFRIG